MSEPTQPVQQPARDHNQKATPLTPQQVCAGLGFDPKKPHGHYAIK